MHGKIYSVFISARHTIKKWLQIKNKEIQVWG